MAGKVWVICKLPHGLHLDMPVLPVEGQNQTGERDMETRITINGQNAEQVAGGLITPVSNKPGVTEVDKDFWEAWSKAYKDFPPLRSGMIFAVDKDPNRDEGVRRDIEDMRKEKNGFDPIEPDAPAPGVEQAPRGPGVKK